MNENYFNMLGSANIAPLNVIEIYRTSLKGGNEIGRKNNF